MLKTCVVCGSDFEVLDARRSTCSTECSKERRREISRNSGRKCRAKNPEKFKEYARSRHANNPGLKREQRIRAFIKDPDKVRSQKNESAKRRRDADPEKYREQARERGRKRKELIRDYFSVKCQYCDCSFTTTRTNTKYCSCECGVKAANERRKLRWRETYYSNHDNEREKERLKKEKYRKENPNYKSEYYHENKSRERELMGRAAVIEAMQTLKQEKNDDV